MNQARPDLGSITIAKEGGSGDNTFKHVVQMECNLCINTSTTFTKLQLIS